LVESQAGYNGDECVYVADNPIKDFIGPKALGWGTVRIRRKQGLHFAAESVGDVDIELPDLTTLDEVLNLDSGPQSVNPKHNRGH
jgi:putative hydrolase of the HAD superfamily